MALFGRGKKKPPAEDPAPANKAGPRAGDVFSPFWSSWPPPPAEPSQPTAEVPPPAPAPPVAPSEPPRASGSQNPPPVTTGPPVVVRRVHVISDYPQPSPAERLRLAMERGDWEGARASAREILVDDPTNLDAIVAAEQALAQLRARDELRLGPLDRVLTKTVPDDWLAGMELDPKIAFLLSRVDGGCTIEELLEVCGMERDEAVAVIFELLEESVLTARPPLQR